MRCDNETVFQRDKTTTWQNDRNTYDHEHDKQNELTTRLSNNLTIRLIPRHIGAKRDKRDTTCTRYYNTKKDD